MSDKNRIIIFDTTMRDGEQSPGASMSLEEKLQISRVFDELGIDIIEAGFPIASPGDFEAVTEISKSLKKSIPAGLARATKKDIDACHEALKHAKNFRIHTFISTSPLHMKHKLNKSPEEVLNAIKESVSYARKFTDDVEWSCEDGTRTDMDYMCKTVELAIKSGAKTINIPDTVGYTVPSEFKKIIETLLNKVPNIDKAIISTHCHNDLGLAVANSLAGVMAGARQIECTINGIGERAGNAALEEVIMALHTRKDYYQVDLNIDPTQIYRSSRLVSDITGFAIQPNKAVTGGNAFRHASGIHQDGLLKDRTTYEIMDPQMVGWPSSELVLGKLSGRHGLKSRLNELGYEPSDAELNRLFEEFKVLADKKREVTDRDLEALMKDQRRSFDETFTLDQIQVTCGDQGIPTATITVTGPDGTSKTDAATGTGPVDAVYQAINRVINVDNELTEFSVKSVTEGIDAVGEVVIRIVSDESEYVGRGADTDIIVASAKAYMNALNRLLSIGVVN